MRLINTDTGLIEEFIGDDIPEYAILSHTWEKDEISLQEFQRLTDPDFADDPKTAVGKAKAGFVKIKGCVELAASKGIPYVWIDTCCIDKTSSADLTESINSMYRWYANSKVCFAYLVDVQPVYGVDEPPAWEESRWFSRGWTLQELIAPSDVKFYCNSWDSIGSREHWSLILSKLTGIPDIFLKANDLLSASVAQKMSWASHRKTTRKEDMAYCLLGLFDINMPLLYGEGENAFLRLQEAIAVSTTDHSLFAWGVRSGSLGETGQTTRSYRSIFARSPADFAECGDLFEMDLVRPESWTQTNRGFHAVFPTLSCAVAKQLLDVDEGDSFPAYIDDTDHLVVLNCRSLVKSVKSVKSDNRYIRRIVGIWVTLIDPRDDGKHGFCRVTDTTTRLFFGDVRKLFGSSPDKFLKDMWLATTSRTLKVPRNYFSKRLAGFIIPKSSNPYYNFQIHSLYGSHDSIKGHVLLCPLLPLNTKGGLVGAVTLDYEFYQEYRRYRPSAIVVFGFPPSLTKPAAKAFGEIIDENDKDSHKKLEFDKDPLGYGAQRFVELMDPDTPDPNPGDNRIRLECKTVVHTGMVFTQLKIAIPEWYI
jgi:hypothetical protein